MPTGTVTLTYGLWTSHFAADPAVVGWSIRINGETYSVTGVLPRDFVLPMRKVSLLVPFSFTAAQRSNQGAATSSAKSCATAASRLGQLNAQMETIVNHLIDRVPGTRRLLPEERIYLSAEQTPLNSMGLVAKTAMEPSSIVSQARGAVQAMDPEQATSEVRTMDQRFDLGRAPHAHDIADPVRRNCPDPMGDRHQRCARIRRGATRARACHPPGSGSRSRIDPPTRPWPRVTYRRVGNRGGGRRGEYLVTVHEVASVRDAAARSRRVRRGVVPTALGRSGGVLRPGARATRVDPVVVLREM